MSFTATVNEVTGVTGVSRNSFLYRLKEEFIPAWEDHYHKKVVIASLIAKKKGTMGGRRSLTSVMSRPPQSAGIALRENDDLPTPRVSAGFNPSIMSRAIYTRIRRTGHVERAARKGDKVAWSQPATEELRAARIQGDLNFARMLYLGPRQILGTFSGETSETVYPFYGRNSRTSQAADRHKYGLHYFRINMELDFLASSVTGNPVIRNTADGTTAGGSVISAMDATLANPTITIQTYSGTDPADNSFSIPWNSRAASVDSTPDADSDSLYAGPNGLLNMVVDRNIETFVYGVQRSTEPTLEAVMINNSTGGVRPFKEDYVTLAVDRIGDDGTGDDPDTLLCHKSVRREFVKEVLGDRRFPEVIKTKGFGALKQVIGDVQLPLVTDRDCMPGVMWVLETEGFGWFSEADMQMVDEGERFVADKDAHEVVMVKSGNCATRKPHNNAMIDDIQYSVSGLTDL